MKPRPFLWLAVLLLSVIAFTNLAVAMQATDPDAPMQPESMAVYFPEGTDFLISVRVDEAFFAQLDQFALLLTGAFTAYDIPRVSLRDALRASNLDLDIVLPWLGEYAAFGVEANQENVMDYGALYLIAQIDDEAGARAFASIVGFTGDGDVMTQPSSGMMIRFLDGMVLISQADTALPEGSTLADNPDFQRVIGALPADGYNAIAYASEAVYQTAVMSTGVGMTGQENPFGATNDVALGLTILDGTTYTIDSAQLPLDGALSTGSPIDPAFTQFIPASSNLFFQAHDLSNLIDGGLDLVDQFATISSASFSGSVMQVVTPVPMPSPREQIEAGLSLIGIDLEDDILSWTTGDFAVFARAELRDIAASIIRLEPSGMAIQNCYDFGMIVEATDPERAQALVSSLNTLINQFAGNSPEVEIGSETINGVSVTTIDAYPILATYPQTDKTAVQLILGASDGLFFFGTRGAITEILSGGGSIADSEAYADALRYILPNPTTIAYTDSEGFIVGLGASPFGVIPLALLGPAIGNIFDNIVAELNRDFSVTPTPTPSPTPTPTPDVDALLSPLDYTIRTIYHGTLSATVTEDGITLIRVTASLKG